MKQPNNIAILLLAAGASRRMGQPKQLLKINATQTLLDYTISVAKNSSCSQIAVVLGANANIIEPTISNQQIAIVKNKNWEQGMGTSLQKGLQFLLTANPSLEAIIISVCDQPYLSTEIFLQLVNTYTTTKAPIVSCQYGNRLGVPALLDKQFFPQLLSLKADEGARKIIRGNLSKVHTVEFPKGAIDLDTPEIYEAYLKRKSTDK